ncbi:MAG: hypothetical protein HQK77_22455 [Desulfobacterales bacterium]|nr:hypothetical protein [Desulfobacterales bacterium]
MSNEEEKFKLNKFRKRKELIEFFIKEIDSKTLRKNFIKEIEMLKIRKWET